MVGVTFLPPLLAEFHRAHPGIVLELREEGSHRIEELVLGRELNVGAVVLPTDEQAFATLPFVDDELRVVLPAAHPLARRRTLALEDLKETPFLLYRPEFALHGHIREACRRRGFEPRVVSESSHWDFIVAMVAAGIGVAFLPDPICRQVDRAQVRTLRLAGTPIPWRVALIWRDDRQLAPATRAWLELARRRLVPGKALPHSS
jgi:DNA-binding transcriptional LysR family regulator